MTSSMCFGKRDKKGAEAQSMEADRAKSKSWKTIPCPRFVFIGIPRDSQSLFGAKEPGKKR